MEGSLIKYLQDNISINSKMIETFFANAIEKNDSTTVQRLIENGVSVNLPLDDLRSSPLHIAVQLAQLDIVKLLLQHQADINAVDDVGQTTLHRASSISTEIASLLQLRKIAISCRIELMREKIISIQDRSLEIIRLLLINRGCNVNAKDENGFTPLYKIFYDPSIRCIKAKMAESESGHVILDKQRVATIRRIKTNVIDLIRENQSQKLKLLLEHGADVETRYGDTEDTILHVVIGDLETSRDFEQFENTCFVDGSHAEMIKEILNLKLVDVNVKNKEGRTPMIMAVSVLSADIVRVLVNHGADLSSVVINQFVYPKTPPCLEAVENLLDIVEMRISKGFPLSSNETLAVLEFFIAYSFDIYEGDYDADRKFREFLEFGTEEVIIRELTKIVNKIHGYSDSMVMSISSESKLYLLKMRECSLHVSQKVESLLKHIISKDTLTLDLNNHYSELLAAEADAISSKSMNDESLQDILNSPLNKIYSFLKNNEYEVTVIRTNLGLTSGIVKGFFARAFIRRFAVKIANDNLRLALATSLSDSCCEAISKYLNNWDILNLFKATSIPPRRPETS